MNPILISTIALIISIASFVLAFYQFRQTQRFNKLKKINETIKSVFELKKSAAELKKLIDITDDITSHSDILKK